MNTLLRNKKGLSTVVTTLIILVVSVLLATVVTFYAINVTTTRVQEESIQITKLHFWHNGTTYSEAAFLIVNTGGRDLVLDKISVRGQESVWDSIYYNKTTGAISPDLTYVTPNADGTLTGLNVTLGLNTYDLTAGVAGQDMILRSGWSMIVYITNPDSLSVGDIGVTVGITIFTANAQYYKESNVQAAT
ncbi:MAG TPA: hypothetical protein VJ249_03395 [Candidatus Bathyarchaeia archaeon]|nr:hypothetical protein [Candidatus Bathyarchaeia archaeon]